jgi:hypothetical protein
MSATTQNMDEYLSQVQRNLNSQTVIFKDGRWKELLRSCIMAGLGIGGVKPPGSAIRVFIFGRT